jgi:hypothetical protein
LNTMRSPRTHRITTALGILLMVSSSVSAAAADTSTAPSSGASAAPAAAPDGGWPRSMSMASGATLIMYQPQLLSWDGETQLVAMAAIEYLATASATPQLGTIKIKSPTSVSMDTRLVQLTKVQVSDIRFTSLTKDQLKDVTAEIEKSMPTAPLVIALDRVLAMMDKSQIRAQGVQLKTDAPPIFASTQSAILVQFDGEPILSPIEGTTLQYAVNTNWDVFQDTSTKLFFLRNNANWFQTADPAGGWTPVKDLPAGFSKLPADDNWKEVRANIPGTKIDAKKMPAIFVSKTPAELILLDGDPKHSPVKGTNLLWVSNTASDVFRMKDSDFYFLVTGRWFRASKLEGPWTFATPNLPPDFQNIPSDHERARVLSSVPGTNQAAEAVLLAQVPQTARVTASTIKAPDVKYAGDPQFKQVEGSSVAYAANCSNDVVEVQNTYYLCAQGVWFSSAAPVGPWVVTTAVPKEIYAMPPSSPVYNVTYVVVVDPSPMYPMYAYYPGYMGVTIAFGCPMYGTGFYYPPYYYRPPYGYPVYYPRPVTYGCGAMYNPYTGAYGYASHAYGPYGGVSYGASYNPATGTYKRGAVAYGPGGAAGYGQAYSPRTGTYAQTKQGSNAYGSWGSSSVQRGDQWATSQHTTNANGQTKWSAQGSGGGSAAGVSGKNGSAGVAEKNGNIYAGKDGNVYKKTDSGWESVGGGNSPKSGASASPATGAASSPSASSMQNKPSGPSADTQKQLDHDAQSRSQGEQRTQQASHGGGSYGGGGGGAARGGGGGGRHR